MGDLTTRVVLFGRNSSIGRPLAATLAGRGFEVIAAGSADCDLRSADSVARFCAQLPRGPFSVVSLAVINKTVANSFEAFTANVAMAKNLAAALGRLDVASVVYFSSVDVYGRPAALPITERTPIAPDTWYGLAKYASEWALGSSGELACPVTQLRIPGVFGTTPDDPSVIGRLTRAIRDDGAVTIHGAGAVRRDYVHVADVCELVLRLLPLRHHGPVNVATGESRSILEIAAEIGAALGRRFTVRHAAADPAREFDLVFDNTLLRTLVPGFAFRRLGDAVRAAGAAACAM